MILTWQANRPIPEPFLIQVPNFTWEAFLEFATEDISCELIGGNLIVHSPASLEYEQIFQWLLLFFNRYLKKIGKGIVLGSRFVMKLSPTWAPEPDLMIILSDLSTRLKENCLDGPADLVIEILSPATRELDLNKKLPQYIHFGVKEVWIVDPEEKEIQIHTQSSSASLEEGTEVVSKIFPDLHFETRWIWRRNQFDPVNMALS